MFALSHFAIFGPVWLSLGTALCSCPAAVPFGHPLQGLVYEISGTFGADRAFTCQPDTGTQSNPRVTATSTCLYFLSHLSLHVPGSLCLGSSFCLTTPNVSQFLASPVLWEFPVCYTKSVSWSSHFLGPSQHGDSGTVDFCFLLKMGGAHAQESLSLVVMGLLSL